VEGEIMPLDGDSGWESYSRLVLQQLETLSKGINALREELLTVKQQLTELKVKEDKVQDLKEWKEKIDEVASPTQLKAALKEIEDLKIFKTKAVTIFAVIQVGIAMAYAILESM
jgi:polyribonucleotide nucleotidyltransferase